MAFTTIDDPEKHHVTKLWTGLDDSRSITGVPFQPDFLWMTSRSNGYNNAIFDSSRGVTKELLSNSDADETNLTTGPDAFTSDGFTFSGPSYNTGAYTFVGWMWKANGASTTTNDASATSIGSIDSVYQANTTAGFSIVQYTGTGSTGSIAHGLGGVPEVILIKNRSKSAGESWTMYHHKNTSAPQTENLQLNTNNATSDTDAPWNDTAPTSTVFTVKNDDVTNDSGETFIAYCFRSIQGYSHFGHYTGNGNDEGPMIYTGFKPAFFMLRRTDSGNDWLIFDNKKDSAPNPIADFMQMNTTDAENSDTARMDFVANGVKMRDSPNALNASSGNYVYWAFAEAPQHTSNGTPTQAE